MPSESGDLIFDLGVVIAAAALVCILFHQLRAPVIIGYILTGVLLGPHLFSPPLIGDLYTVRQLGELGVVFLFFSIGMDFDLRRLQRLAAPAILALALQAVGLIFFAVLFGPIWQWNTLNSLFFGCLLTVSSSMVTIRVMRDQGRLDHPHGQLALAVLILEDIVALLMLVVLTGVSVARSMEVGVEWLITFGIGVSVVLLFIVGRIIAPGILNLINRIGSIELITICSVGFVLAVSVLAQKFHFSVALCAFLAGSVISQSTLVDAIERSTLPLRDIFGALFFVFIGMLFDPKLLLDTWGWIILLALIVIMVKVLSCWTGMFLAGQSSRNSFRAAMAKCQIGEFSFVIAYLGASLGVADGNFTTIAVGVAVITILATPVLNLRSDEVFSYILRRTPDRVLLISRFYRNLFEAILEVIRSYALLRILKRPMIQNLIYFFLINGIIILAYLIANYLEAESGTETNLWVQSCIWLLAALAVVPILVALVRNLNAVVVILTETALKQLSADPRARGRMRNVLNAAVMFIIHILVAAIFLAAAARYFPSGLALILFLALLLVSGLLYWRRINVLQSHLEYMFLRSFDQQLHSRDEEKRRSVLQEIADKYPWPVKLREMTISKGTVASGRRIIDLELREKTGCSIIALSRGGEQVIDPAPEVPLFSGDRLVILGNETQHGNVERLLGAPALPDRRVEAEGFEVDRVYLGAESPLAGNTLAGADLRRRHGITVVGIQRGAERIVAPSPNEMMDPGDVLFVVGSRRAIEAFSRDS